MLLLNENFSFNIEIYATPAQTFTFFKISCLKICRTHEKKKVWMHVVEKL